MVDHLIVITNYYDSAVSLINIILSFIVLYCYSTMKDLSKPPGKYLLIQCVIQTCIDVFWALSGVLELLGYYIYSRDYLFGFCEYQAIVKFCLFCISWNYNSFLCYEIYIRMKEPLGMGYTKRNRIYHFLGIFSSLLLTVLLRLVDGFKESKLMVCFVADSWVRYVLFIFIIHFVFALYVIYTARKYMKQSIPKERKRFLKVYTINLAVYSIFSMFVVMYYMMSTGIIPILEILAELITFSSGLFGVAINLARLQDPSIRKQLKNMIKGIKYCFRSKSTSSPNLIPNQDSFNDMTLDPSIVGLFLDLHIEVISIQSVLSQFIGLFIYFHKYLIDYDTSTQDLFRSSILSAKVTKVITSIELPILGNIDLANRFCMFRCAVREYLPEVFYHYRNQDNIDNQFIADSFDPVKNEVQLMSGRTTLRRSEVGNCVSYNTMFCLVLLEKKEQKDILTTVRKGESLEFSVYGIYTLYLEDNKYRVMLRRNLNC